MLILSIFLPCLIMANLVKLGNFMLNENEIQAKSRYVFSDFSKNPNESILKNATVTFDIAVYMRNYDLDPSSFIKLYIFAAESENQNQKIIGTSDRKSVV